MWKVDSRRKALLMAKRKSFSRLPRITYSLTTVRHAVAAASCAGSSASLSKNHGAPVLRYAAALRGSGARGLAHGGSAIAGKSLPAMREGDETCLQSDTLGPAAGLPGGHPGYRDRRRLGAESGELGQRLCEPRPRRARVGPRPMPRFKDGSEEGGGRRWPETSTIKWPAPCRLRLHPLAPRGCKRIATH